MQCMFTKCFTPHTP